MAFTKLYGAMDSLSPIQRSERMSRVRSRDTKPEMLVRRVTHRLGYRYRLHKAGLPGKPDLVFAGRRKVIFVHGCFWHRHPDPECKLARLPKSRHDFWIPKLEGNRARDERVARELMEQGWGVLEIWECQCKKREQLENAIREFLDEVG
ncbi:DNA mismatch endonuclease Vsr [Sphingomonas sp. QA11]|uniref:very short patch repair endonuclease n=1 Tax=Sphingomonas sp. QA11 TaxID=2950605 RepID=UPI002349502D|nr:DNA mismatch endonuclease Vsr [Sphingomonas sp. QA11]WCM28371.1 DNA mismatch endonuclease Vsr [Sphingomonas sp. QA11]